VEGKGGSEWRAVCALASAGHLTQVKREKKRRQAVAAADLIDAKNIISDVLTPCIQASSV
jgi:hypothetical protein